MSSQSSPQLVSVIIPCYKLAHFLPQAIESALGQTHPHVEVIVIDDESPDDVAAVMTRYAGDTRVRLIQQRNQGVSAARNTGIAAAQGSYVQFLDADDWIHPTKLARQIERFEQDPAIGLVYCDFYTVRGENELTTEWSTEYTFGPLDGDLFTTYWMRWCMPLSSVLVRREWIDRGGEFNVSRELSEDYEYWMRLSALGCKAAYVPERLAYYRRHDANRSSNGQAARNIAARVEIMRRFPSEVTLAVQTAMQLYETKWAEVSRTADDRQALIEQQHAQLTNLEENFREVCQWVDHQAEIIASQSAHMEMQHKRLVESETKWAEVCRWADQQAAIIEEKQSELQRLGDKFVEVCRWADEQAAIIEQQAAKIAELEVESQRREAQRRERRTFSHVAAYVLARCRSRLTNLARDLMAVYQIARERVDKPR